MAKKVRYNGGTESYYGCSDPTNLILGKEYEVVLSRDLCWQTNYTLNGVEGEFNSVWFDEISSDDQIYVAVSNELPVIGERYLCYKMEFVREQPKLIAWNTSRVQAINYLGNNIYQVNTLNSVYIVNVG
ncbi:MAG: hypothetical protein Q4G09_05025 [Clostridia bacterium]|nr:hypothetical protein [Clostridia bacterium]